MAEPQVTSLGNGNLNGPQFTTLSSTDGANIDTVQLPGTFNVLTDILQGYVYDNNGSYIDSITTGYKVEGEIDGTSTNTLILDPGVDAVGNGYTQGTYQLQYNYLNPLLTNNIALYIVEISLDRTELRVNSRSLNNLQLLAATQTIQADLNDTNTFEGYYLDFGQNQLEFAVNVGYLNNSILIKLYQPLPTTIGTGNNFNVYNKISDSSLYSVTFPQEEIALPAAKYLRGPNTNLRIKTQTNNTTVYKDILTLTSGSTSGITNQLNSVLAENRAELNTDYTDYSNFSFFSSANTRLTNFNYKATQLETFSSQIATLNAVTNVPLAEISASKGYYQNQIESITKNFDGYDYYLYYNSSSYAWPKQNSTPPYTLYSYTSSEATNWLNTQSNTAIAYDRENRNNLFEIFPSYITDDTANAQFQLFSELTAQMFDEIWLYTKALENRQDGDNRLGGGISIDLVADALESYGVDLYASTLSDSDAFTSLLGLTSTGGTLPPTGSELITTYVTSSAETTPFNEAQKLIYKRIYHNLPYLLKKKGTVAGLRVLLNCYGIPDTILRISEFGGKDKNANTWDYWYSQFNYAFQTSGSGYISTPWDGPAFISYWLANSPISLPLVSGSNGDYNMTVDWGDGNTDTITAWDDAAKTHNYGASGNYTVTINGTCKGFAFNNTGYTSSIIDVIDWGSLELSTSASFYGANNLGGNRPSNEITATNRPLISTTSFKDAFRGASILSGSLEGWKTNTVTSLETTFKDASGFNSPLDWNTENVTTLQGTFENAIAFNKPLSWNTSLTTNMSGTFSRAMNFDADISGWNTSNVTNFREMFHSASAFNQTVDSFNTAAATTMKGMFSNATSFSQQVLSWNVGNVLDFSEMFLSASSFTNGGNQTLDNWVPTKATTMNSMFKEARSFNSQVFTLPVGSPPVITDLGSMFESAIVYNNFGFNTVKNWDVSNVNNMSNMFKSASAFNQELDIWVTTSATNMSGMFEAASSFNQDIGDWDTTLVTNMDNMFKGASSFNQDISDWDIRNLQYANNFMSGSAFSTVNYDLLLQEWAIQAGVTGAQSGVAINFGSTKYTDAVSSASRSILTSPPYNWLITDGGFV
tara:strand:+ start:7568 stop:10867 length:3300 start_codon:yes stop_codon:yes gene_type:complete